MGTLAAATDDRVSFAQPALNMMQVHGSKRAAQNVQRGFTKKQTKFLVNVVQVDSLAHTTTLQLKIIGYLHPKVQHIVFPATLINTLQELYMTLRL